MLLRSLKLKNFRQYKGEQKIEFSCDPGKNVTIILGNNTYGKTTLLQAFYWCFYKHASLDNPENMLNYDIMWSMHDGDVEEVLVEVDLYHGGLEYTITTSQEYRRNSGKVKHSRVTTDACYIADDGQAEPIDRKKVNTVIRSILPEDLSDYFFFDTERVERISEKKDLTDSVKGLLGLAPLENAKKHIGIPSQERTVLGKLNGDLDRDGADEASRAETKMHEAQERLDEIEGEITRCQKQIDEYEELKEGIEKDLRGYEPTRKLQGRKKELEKGIQVDKELLEDNSTNLRKVFGSNFLRFFAAPLVVQTKELLEEADISDKGIRDLTRVTLEDILQHRDTCICGLRFDEHPEAVEHIKNEMRYCPPESIGNAVRHYQDDTSAFTVNMDDVIDSITNIWKNITSAKLRIQSAEDEIDDIDVKIGKKISGEDLESRLSDVKRGLRERHDELIDLNREQVAKEDEVARNRKIFDSHAMASEKNAETQLFIDYAEEIRSWLIKTLAAQEEETRADLEAQVNDLFSRMYHGKRRVAIDSKYQVHLYAAGVEENRETGESGGLNSVKNFAFIAGLVSIAKKKKAQREKSRGTEIIELDSYPLVMDAPFSKADEIHTSNISRVLPEASEQVIMFVMHKDWQHAEPVLSDRVGAEYELVKHSEQHSSLKEI